MAICHFASRLDTAEENIHEFKDLAIEIIPNEAHTSYREK